MASDGLTRVSARTFLSDAEHDALKATFNADNEMREREGLTKLTMDEYLAVLFRMSISQEISEIMVNTKHVGAMSMYGDTVVTPTTIELLCAEISNLRTALKSAKMALELGLLAAKHCSSEMPGLENALDVLEIELAIAKAEAALK